MSISNAIATAPSLRGVSLTRRVTTELLITVAATVIVAVGVLLLGTVTVRPLVLSGDLPLGDARRCHEAPVGAVSDSGVEGAAWLCNDRLGLRPVLRIHGLQEGEVYTAWLAYFDRPAGCFHTPCGFHDLRGEDPAGVLGRVDGAIAPPSRELELRADLRDLRPTTGAQVTLLVLNHGVGVEADGRARARQLLTPRMFDLGAPMAGALADRGRGLLHAQAILTVK